MAPALGNALYWHHGYHLEPRMLYETAPAWCLLAALALAELTREASRRSTFFSTLGAPALASALLLQLPARLAASPWDEEARARTRLPAIPEPANAVVFVHGSWPALVAARLAGAGMRRDSVETALRRNDLCRVERYAMAREAGVGGAELPPLDLLALPGSPPHLRGVQLSPGTFMRVDPRLPADPSCRREARADRHW